MLSQQLWLDHGKAAGPVNRYHKQRKNTVLRQGAPIFTKLVIIVVPLMAKDLSICLFKYKGVNLTSFCA